MLDAPQPRYSHNELINGLAALLWRTRKVATTMGALSSAKKAAVCGVVVASTVLGSSVPAYASDEMFITCASNSGNVCDNSPAKTIGYITWYNRSALVSGDVYDIGAGGTTAIFEAMISGNSKPVDLQTRFADDTNPNYPSPRGFSFTLETDLVGGFDRIRITVCKNYQTASQVCSVQDNYWRY